ncbi:helix-turn-helix domain-containing protein [Marinobacter salinexigens]|uniref:Helix-turn-helix domain-containing protein n=1 Tax=Marinobacter salinexigens TaxID=2919747 RepID=A0A5B0VF84_9GAMM|nr:helix-turn-helix domain-containing protein [Marinobacter salinexigens]KAA1173267.1 helix-turn-helix domain-containing protein [Marinobacter salinexigens]|tara:strand:- start:1068 stop:2030 length:963 start_codon:yes stop_codon:yes gene_type:complete
MFQTQNVSALSESQSPIPYDEWTEKLKSVYGLWNPRANVPADFTAKVAYRSSGNFEVVTCVCDPCGATRHAKEIAGDDIETLAMQLVLSGRERFTIDSKCHELMPGDILLWNTTRPMEFDVTEKLHKISVLMPLARLRSWLPGSWYLIDSKYSKDSTTATMLCSLIQTMTPEFLSGKLENSEALTDAMIGTLVSTLGPAISLGECYERQQLIQIKQFIDKHLSNPELSLKYIASAHRISLRHLHSLFESEGQTALQYIIHQRLLRCQRDLSNPGMSRRTITEIALSWGFQHSTHFSRRFKSEFGVTPHDFRHDPGIALSR